MAIDQSNHLEDESELLMTRFVKVVALIFILNLAYYAVVKFVFHGSYPINSYLFNHHSRFSDFYRNYRFWRDDVGQEALAYRIAATSMDPFPFWNLYHYPFTRIKQESLAVALYLLSSFLIMGAAIWSSLSTVVKNRKYLSVVVLLLTSYATQFTFERGNVEFVAFLFISLCVKNIDSNSHRAGLYAVLAMAIKPWSAIIFVIFLKRKDWSTLFRSILAYVSLVISTPVIIRLSAGMGLKDLFQLGPQIDHFTNYSDQYIGGGSGLAYGNSLYGALKVLLELLGSHSPDSMLVLPYTLSVVALMLFLICVIYFNQVSQQLAVSILITCVVFLPYVSADYKLLYLFVVATQVSQINTTINGQRHKRAIMMLLAIAVSAKSMIRIDNHLQLVHIEPILSSVLISPILLVAILVHLIRLLVLEQEEIVPRINLEINSD